MKASETLVAAKSLLENEGWIQKNSYLPKSLTNRHYNPINRFFGGQDKNGYCVSGAIDNAFRKWDRNVHGQAVRYFKRAANIEFSSIENWNDTRGRRKSEVFKTLDQAIALAKSENN